MDPKDKAKEIYDKYYKLFQPLYMPKAACREAKICCNILIDEITTIVNNVSDISGNYFRGTESNNYVDADIELKFWNDVRIEISKINEY